MAQFPIRIRMPGSNMPDEQMSLAREEREAVQQYFDTSGFDWTQDTLSFVFLRGICSVAEQMMHLAGVFVYSGTLPIHGFRCRLLLRCGNLSCIPDQVLLDIPAGYTGIMQCWDGLLVHIDVPVQDLREDTILSGSDMSGQMDHVELFPADYSANGPDDRDGF